MALIDYITEIQFDFGALNAVAAECARVGISRPFICTDRGVVAAGLLQRLTTALDDLRVAVYDGTPANPTEAAVREAVEGDPRHGADGLIALGGGSPINLAKAVAIAATHAGPLAHCATIEGGSPRIGSQVAPLIAIPTTAGAGSEVARGAIIIVDDGRKLGLHSWHLVPKGAIRDPELTLGLPAGLTAATGMDAMAHCIETYLSRAVNPPADAIAFDGPRRARGFIERAVRDGSDREARWQMMSASDAGRDGLPEGPGSRAFAVTFARRTGAASASRHAERAAAAGDREVQRRRGAGERARHCRHVRRRWRRWAH